MMRRILAITLLLAASIQQATVAQEYAGNWWVNPQTRQVEGIGENNALPRSTGSSEGEGSWVEVATDASGDRWLAKFLRVRQFGSRNPEVVFLGRVRPARRAVVGTDTGSYAADCATGRLIRLSDSKIEDGFDVPTLPGTIGAALHNWACQ